jgi:hypothetical protein
MIEIPELKVEVICDIISMYAESHIANPANAYNEGKYLGAVAVAEMFLSKEVLEAIEAQVKEDLGII